MKTYEMQVQTEGWAEVQANTRREATEKARRQEYSKVRLHPASALVSTIKEKK